MLGWREAEAAEREIRAAEGPLSPTESLAWAEALNALNPAAMSQPDPVREREVEQARDAWNKLRLAMGWNPESQTVA